LSLDDIRDAPVFLPPLDEQNDIFRVIMDQTFRLNGLVTEARRTISLLQERRSALISAAVTGQIDVRALVPEAAAA
jgi:type I restriction enzyme S subunit